MTTKTLYRVVWRSKITGWSSGGVPYMTRAEAEALRDERNARWPILDHWIEPATEETEGSPL